MQFIKKHNIISYIETGKNIIANEVKLFSKYLSEDIIIKLIFKLKMTIFFNNNQLLLLKQNLIKYADTLSFDDILHNFDFEVLV